MALRIAYLILAHKSPSQVVRLVQRLQGPDRTFVIHVDRNSPTERWDIPHASLSQPNVFWAERIACAWGSFSLVQATLSCIETLYKSAPPVDFVVLLSGQDYPIKSNDYIEEFLSARKGECLMFFHRFPYPERWKNGGYQRLPTWRVQIKGKPRRVVPAIASPLLHRRPPLGYHPCGGSQWWALPGEAVTYVREFLGSHPDFLSYFQDALYPDEMVFHTVLGNSNFRPTTGDHHLHFMRWEPKARSPEVLVEADLPALRATARCFARKFDSHPLLDMIDEEILGLPPFREAELTNSGNTGS